ncbi:MAG: S46 family peptidase [FCB group bacterium]|nr:S46 family peptidase [FCB group bacterium]
MSKPFTFKIIVIFFCLIAASIISADEGMWPLYDIEKLPFDSLHARGLTLEPEDIYNPSGGSISNAIIDISGGSASFVSADGLIITNHHIAFGAVQKSSTVDNNYIKDGFYAATRAEEIQAIGFHVYITLAIEDVTDRVLESLDDDLDDLARYEALDLITKEIVKENETEPGIKCKVAKMFGGSQFMLYTMFDIPDVRIVYAPPENIGLYGGDIDNWMWPRHCGDFSFLRAYVAPDGSSAEYSEDNVPYQPEVYLPISSAGVSENDFTMMLGFPGRTKRYASSFNISQMQDFYYPRMIEFYETAQEIMDKVAEDNPGAAIKLASLKMGLQNGLKNNQATLEGFRKSKLLALKRETEQQLTEFIKANPELDAEYGGVLPELDSLYTEEFKVRDRGFILGWLVYSSEQLRMATSLYRWAIEREKEDIDRDKGYQDRDTTNTLAWLQYAQINLLPELDRAMLEKMIKRALKLPAGQKIEAVEKIFAGKADWEKDRHLKSYINRLFSQSNVGNLEKRLAMFRMSREELENLNDPMINLAISLKPERDTREEESKLFSGAHSRLAPKLMQVYRKWKEGNLYPDANGTMRFNYGAVTGYSPRDGMTYDYLTSLTGILEKETGEDPFIVPEKLKAAIESKDFGPYLDPTLGEVPVNFLSTNDGTGGNSGSSILNGKGEIIGLEFDTNFESVAADYLCNEKVARSICVDIRYVLFIIDKVYHLDNLMKELTIN